MHIEWLDVLKLTVPLLIAVLMVWVKTKIENHMLRKSIQLTLSRLINDEVTQLPDAVDALKQIAEAAKNGRLRLVSMDVSPLLTKLSLDLTILDAANAYCYVALASSAEVVNKGIARLSSLVLSRATTTDDKVSDQLDRVLISQSQAVALDCVTLGEAYVKAVQEIPSKGRYQDAQGINTLTNLISSARMHTEPWPILLRPPPEAVDRGSQLC